MTSTPPLAPADVLNLAYPLEARLSPDGRFAAHTVATVDRSNMTDQTSIWLADVDTGESRQLTAPGSLDTGPSWSPDGRSIAFRSTRSGVGQIHVVERDGGAARELTSLAPGVGMLGPFWSPAGAHIAFTARPGPPRDPAVPFRVTRQFWRLDGAGLVDDAKNELFVIDAQGGEPRQLTDHAGLIMSAEWSPAGDEILYVAFAENETPKALVRVRNITTGETRTIHEEDNYFFPPAVGWLPDGRIARTTTNFVNAAFPPVAIVVHGREGEPPETRSDHVHGWIFGLVQGDFPFMGFFAPRLVISDDGRHAYVAVQHGGAVEVWEVSLVGEQHARPVVAGDQASQPYAMSGDRLLVATATMYQPPDLWIVHTDTGAQRRLTALNDDHLPDGDAFDVEHLTFDAADGATIEGWFLCPKGAAGPVPTVLYNHGGPHAAWGHIFNFDNHMLTSAGYGVLMVNQHGSTGYSRDFAVGLHGHWGELDISDLMTGVDVAVERGLADPARLGVFGISAGAFLTAWLAAHTDRFKAGVVESPCLNFSTMTGGDVGWHYASWMGAPSGMGVEPMDPFVRFSATTYSASCTTPMLIIQHELDWRTPATQSDEYYAQLRQHGCVAEMLRMPVTGHTGSIELGSPVTRVAQNEAILDWMNRFVLKA